MNRHTGFIVAVAATVAPAFLLISVTAKAPLIDQKPTRSDSEYLEQVFAAPIVIVGSILSDTLVSRPIPSHWDPQIPLQFRRLQVRVENILRGDPIPKTAIVYYFTWAGGFNGPRPLGFWMVEQPTARNRRILWLRYDSGMLRTACDGWDYCTIPVKSGAHPHYQGDPRKPLGNAIADIVFTRGEGATDVPVVRAAACKHLSYYRQVCVSSR